MAESDTKLLKETQPNKKSYMNSQDINQFYSIA